MLAGRYPGILNDSVVGAEAKKLYDDAQKMLDQIIHARSLAGKWCRGILSCVKD